MGRAFLFGRLAAKDLRRHLSEGVLLFLVIAAASATLTLGLVLHGETSNPYSTTRAATNGPDAVANLSPSCLEQRLDQRQRQPGRSRRRGTCARGRRTQRAVPGHLRAPQRARDHDQRHARRPRCRHRATRPACAHRRQLDSRRGGGRRAQLRRRARRARRRSPHPQRQSVQVVGIAVDAATPPYPHVCAVGWCDVIYRASISQEQISLYQPGLIWLSRSATS